MTPPGWRSPQRGRPECRVGSSEPAARWAQRSVAEAHPSYPSRQLPSLTARGPDSRLKQWNPVESDLQGAAWQRLLLWSPFFSWQTLPTTWRMSPCRRLPARKPFAKAARILTDRCARPAKTAASPVVATTFTGTRTGRLPYPSSSPSVPSLF